MKREIAKSICLMCPCIRKRYGQGPEKVFETSMCSKHTEIYEN